MPLLDFYTYKKGSASSPLIGLKKMARPRKNAVKPAETVSINTQIITDSETEREKSKIANSAGSSGSNDITYVACGLPLGIIFDDVDNGQGGYKTVSFPGINHVLQGKATGVLLGAGNAVLVSVKKSDWENIKRKHGKERAFTCIPALLTEVPGGESEFKSRRDEVKEMDNGVSPVDPDSLGVEKAKVSE